jgi:hypothetical protein
MRCGLSLSSEAGPSLLGSGRPKKRKSIFVMIVGALYHSHRLQAERTLQRYRQRVDEAERNILRELKARSGERPC